MPLVRIDLARGKPPGYRHAIADVIYTAMTGVLNVPNDDRFMVITEHDQADLVISPEYLGIGHTAVMLIQVTRNEGRTVPVKWDFYRAVADGLHERTSLRREDCAQPTGSFHAPSCENDAWRCPKVPLKVWTWFPEQRPRSPARSLRRPARTSAQARQPALPGWEDSFPAGRNRLSAGGCWRRLTLAAASAP